MSVGWFTTFPANLQPLLSGNEEMKMDLVEPLRDLFKDEVRRMGVELGLSPEMLYRHPFPGPGLGVRILGEVTKQKIAILQEADHIFIQELIKADLYDKVSQAFAVFLPIKSCLLYTSPSPRDRG